MDCEQLNNDIKALRASRDVFEENFKNSNANLRGGIELRKTRKEALSTSDRLLLKYFEDFEKQHPDKWLRKIGEFKTPTEEEAVELSEHAIEWRKKYLKEGFEPGLYKDEYDAWWHTGSTTSDVSTILIGKGFAYEFLPLGKEEGMFKQVLITTGDNEDAIQRMSWGADGSSIIQSFSIKKKKYTETPLTLTKLDEKTVLVGCRGGGIAIIGEREDGSWGVLADKRWVSTPSSVHDEVPKAFKLKSGRIGLCDGISKYTCVFEVEKNLGKLKRVLGINQDSFDDGESQ